jgi:hypothetical protein
MAGPARSTLVGKGYTVVAQVKDCVPVSGSYQSRPVEIIREADGSGVIMARGCGDDSDVRAVALGPTEFQGLLSVLGIE